MAKKKPVKTWLQFYHNETLVQFIDCKLQSSNNEIVKRNHAYFGLINKE